MTRTLNAQQVYHQMTGVFFHTDGSGTGTTITPASADGGLTVELTAAEGANFAVDEEVRLGPNGNTVEINEIASITADELTFKLPLSRAIPIGTAVNNLTATDLGAVDEGGVTIATTQGETALEAGTQRATYLFIPGNLEEAITFNLRDFAQENVAQSVGLDESSAIVVDPTLPGGAVLRVNNFGTLGIKSWKFEGLLEDATAVKAFIMAAKVGAVNQTLQFAFGVATTIPFALRSTGNRSFLFE